MSKKIILYVLVLCFALNISGFSAAAQESTDTTAQVSSESEYDRYDDIIDYVEFKQTFHASFEDFREKINSGEITTDIHKAFTELSDSKLNLGPYVLRRLIHTKYLDEKTTFKEYKKGSEALEIELHPASCETCGNRNYSGEFYQCNTTSKYLVFHYNEVDMEEQKVFYKDFVDITNGFNGKIDATQNYIQYIFWFTKPYYAHISVEIDDVENTKSYIRQFRELCLELDYLLEDPSAMTDSDTTTVGQTSQTEAETTAEVVPKKDNTIVVTAAISVGAVVVIGGICLLAVRAVKKKDQ